MSAMDVKEYKKYHEEYMMNNTGTTIEECIILLSSIPFCIFLCSYLSLYMNKKLNSVFQFLIVILPVILNCTVFSNVNHIIFSVVGLLCTALIITIIDINSVNNLLPTKCEEKKTFISNYRACTNFISAICILAVDFKIFPRRLAKTETFGFGFMDLGVGFFICSNGFVEKHKEKQGQFVKLLKTESVLCVLGLIRVLSVKSVDYHEHVSEYGVHWNFFFTLALCRLLSYFAIILTNNMNPYYLSIVIGGIHQVLLLIGLQDWVLSEIPRNTFFRANREGLVSSLGYVSLYFAASATGKYLFHSRDMTCKKLIVKLIQLCILTWIGVGISLKTINVSRRLVNLGYIFWILALSLTELILFVVLEIVLLSLKNKKNVNVVMKVPSILESINSNGLFFFIFSNLLTGLVNMIFQTLLLGRVMSLIIIVSYMVVLCSVTHFLFLKKTVLFYISKDFKPS